MHTVDPYFFDHRRRIPVLTGGEQQDTREAFENFVLSITNVTEEKLYQPPVQNHYLAGAYFGL